MTVVKCSLTSCEHNEEEICQEKIIKLQMYSCDGFNCDTYKEKKIKYSWESEEDED